MTITGMKPKASCGNIPSAMRDCSPKLYCKDNLTYKLQSTSFLKFVSHYNLSSPLCYAHEIGVSQ
jgi:hypothetical protein